jgi:hypothetical protein
VGECAADQAKCTARRTRSSAAAAPPLPDWETTHRPISTTPALGLKVLWFSTGVDDSLIADTRSTVAMLKKHGFTPVFKESPGAHTWLNWRDYLINFARGCSSKSADPPHPGSRSGSSNRADKHRW